MTNKSIILRSNIDKAGFIQFKAISKQRWIACVRHLDYSRSRKTFALRAKLKATMKWLFSHDSILQLGFLVTGGSWILMKLMAQADLWCSVHSDYPLQIRDHLLTSTRKRCHSKRWWFNDLDNEKIRTLASTGYIADSQRSLSFHPTLYLSIEVTPRPRVIDHFSDTTLSLPIVMQSWQNLARD